MKTFKLLLILPFLIIGLNSCEKENFETFQNLRKTKYYNSEIFAEKDMKIYGTWELYDISGGMSGDGYNLNFEYLEIKEYGVYGFINNSTLLEYGKITIAPESANDLRLKVDFDKDRKSDLFFADNEKYIEFNGNDTLKLISPCCDRFNYHFKRVKRK